MPNRFSMATTHSIQTHNCSGRSKREVSRMLGIDRTNERRNLQHCRTLRPTAAIKVFLPSSSESASYSLFTLLPHFACFTRGHLISQQEVSAACANMN